MATNGRLEHLLGRLLAEAGYEGVLSAEEMSEITQELATAQPLDPRAILESFSLDPDFDDLSVPIFDSAFGPKDSPAVVTDSDPGDDNRHIGPKLSDTGDTQSEPILEETADGDDGIDPDDVRGG